MEEQYKNKSKLEKKNKYNLSPKIKAMIQRKWNNKEWTSWEIMKKFELPINYVKTTMSRGSWQKFANDENL